MTIEEMEDTLERLGIEVVSTRGSEIQGYCPAHVERTGHEDRNPSWWINSDTGAHICFSCHFKGGLLSLVSYIQKWDFDKSKEWLEDGTTNLSAALQKAVKPKKVFEELTYITESMLSAFGTPPEEALKARGLAASAAADYEVLWDNRHSNWITVIRDPYTHKLLGWQEKGHKSRFFRNQPTGVQKSNSLFGFKQYTGGDMIVVESPLDVVRLASVGIKGGVSTYGSIVSMQQFNVIRGADRVIFAMDNDTSGRESSVNLLILCQEYGKEAWFFNYEQTDMKDVGGMSKAEIQYGLEKARHMVHGKKALR